MSPYGREMLKFNCVVLLAVAATVSCIPIEPESSKAGLVRPSPINPDVVSEPLPEEVSTTTTQATRVSNIQKIPARGTKLSATLDQDKSTTEAPAKEKRETATESTTPPKSNFRRDQPSTPSAAHKQTGVTTTTAEPVSLKTPIVHPSGLKVRRSADETTTTTNKTPSGSSSSTTRGPLPDSGSSSSSNDDNSGPHFIRPVPVDQILKNLHEAAPQHHQQVAQHQHEQAKAVVETTTGAADGESSPGTTVNDHKFHRKNKTTTTEAPEEEEEDGGEDSKESSEDDSKQDKQ
ncbi:hypothetical protein quinque_003286 [Culex quinquefasciatus]